MRYGFCYKEYQDITPKRECQMENSAWEMRNGNWGIYSGYPAYLWLVGSEGKERKRELLK